MSDNNELRRQMLALQRKAKAAEDEANTPTTPTAQTDEEIAARARLAMARRSQQGPVVKPKGPAASTNLYDEDDQKLVSDGTKAAAAAAARVTAQASRLFVAKAKEGAVLAVEKVRETKQELHMQPAGSKRKRLVWSLVGLAVVGLGIGAWFSFKPGEADPATAMPVIPPAAMSAPEVPPSAAAPMVAAPKEEAPVIPMNMPMISPGAIEAEAHAIKEGRVETSLAPVQETEVPAPAPIEVQEPPKSAPSMPTPEPEPVAVKPVVPKPLVKQQPMPPRSTVASTPPSAKPVVKKPDATDNKLKEVDDFFDN